MSEADSTALALVGERLFMFKVCTTSANCLWMYDYLLTLGDEIKYAWSGKRTWIFVLFIALHEVFAKRPSGCWYFTW
ncbi:hypothetical protein BDM02DRAFT_2449534 [Thelephora ganbajun]|uniref:Uncharacterized protein n=1 Tax=Thelephora ganbajun TaxID=370292 RepID=A0ACB6ZEG7_THEGA|nr:hypothetical protein BDM02DRAFT_2449534 [Thelephora ganbajun]